MLVSIWHIADMQIPFKPDRLLRSLFPFILHSLQQLRMSEEYFLGVCHYMPSTSGLLSWVECNNNNNKIIYQWNKNAIIKYTRLVVYFSTVWVSVLRRHHLPSFLKWREPKQTKNLHSTVAKFIINIVQKHMNSKKL